MVEALTVRLDPESVSAWMPVAVQIAGVVLMFLLAVASILGHLQDAAVFGPIALGMMLGRYVRDAARPPEPADVPEDDRWSHLP